MDQSDKEKARQARNAYHREWAKKNRDKVNAANMRYWQKKAEQMQKEAKPPHEREQND